MEHPKKRGKETVPQKWIDTVKETTNGHLVPHYKLQFEDIRNFKTLKK
jgi:hypothetical protein